MSLSDRLAFLSGARASDPQDGWIAAIAEATTHEKDLLPQKQEALLGAARSHNAAFAIAPDGACVGCVFLWSLRFQTRLGPLFQVVDDADRLWFELGTFWVREDYRGGDVGEKLYELILAAHPDDNILGTTTNPKAIAIGKKFNMRMIAYASLPEDVRRATCICPASKTGTEDNRRCQLRDGACRVRVSNQTWLRLNTPPLTSWP